MKSVIRHLLLLVSAHMRGAVTTLVQDELSRHRHQLVGP